MDDILREFIGETRETLGAIAGELVAWEADPSDRARLDAIFRYVHTVKGSCGFLDLPRLARLSHAAEDALGSLRDGSRRPDAVLVSAVLAIVDRIGELAEAIETGESLPDQDDQRLIEALDGPATGADSAPSHVRREPGGRVASRTVRLPIELLDRMMAGVSAMVLARDDLARELREPGGAGGIDLAFERMSACVADMRDAVTRARMQRIDTVFAVLPRMVRDLSTQLGKRATIAIEGGEVELDREMIDVVRDPLIHIVRNAIDHGIEAPAERALAGKPAVGRLTVAARRAGDHILIALSDDGRGIDGDKVTARAIAAGLITIEAAVRLDRAARVALILAPGLSTADAVTTVSGRGVGLDVVRTNVTRIGGVVEIDSQPGEGLRVAMRLPIDPAASPRWPACAA